MNTQDSKRPRPVSRLTVIQGHGWLVGLIAGGLIAPWIVR